MSRTALCALSGKKLLKKFLKKLLPGTENRTKQRKNPETYPERNSIQTTAVRKKDRYSSMTARKVNS